MFILDELFDRTVNERVVLGWEGLNSRLTWAQGKDKLYMLEESEDLCDDISFRMKKLALEGYGVKVGLIHCEFSFFIVNFIL